MNAQNHYPISIEIDGRSFTSMNGYSSGPGCPTHTYEIPRGYVRRIADEWILYRAGHTPRKVQFSVK